ncbi:MAG: hypothetical protein U0Q16_05305 [Bryobacteraceae bacterium]
MGKNRDIALLVDEILTDAEGEDEQLWAFRQVFEDNISFPASATVVGSPVEVTKIDYAGNPRRGLIAKCRRADGSKHDVATSDIVFASAAAQRYVAAYRLWMGVTPYPAGRRPQQPRAQEAPSPQPEATLELAVLSVSRHAAECRILPSQETVTLRNSGKLDLVPGEIAAVKPTKQWTHRGGACLSGIVESTRLDVEALGLTPLRLTPLGMWDPKQEYWGEPGEPIEAWARPIIRRGPRPAFEMEQVIPGQDPGDWDSDPIIESTGRKAAGDISGARELLMELCRSDLRCLDAHAHLGSLSFQKHPEHAIRHCEAGVRIGELSLPKRFDGVLPWGLIDNRPFLRCMHNFALCLWRLERFKEAVGVFERMLWMNPSDNQGVRLIIDEVRARLPWRDRH